MMYLPTHPGRVVFHELIEDEDGNHINSIANAAELLAVHRNTLHRLVTEKAGMSVEMALALEKATKSKAEFWMALQTKYDLAVARAA